MILTNIKNKQKESGFTIVELLVVIVVIGILAAITIVSYTGITAKANGTANKSNANSVLSAALGAYAENTSNQFPATAAASETVIANLNAYSTKVPTGITVTNVTPTSGTATAISYRVNAANTGVCVGYWDSTIAVPAVAYLFGGTATADNGTTCS